MRDPPVVTLLDGPDAIEYRRKWHLNYPGAGLSVSAMSQRTEVNVPTEHGLYLRLLVTSSGGV